MLKKYFMFFFKILTLLFLLDSIESKTQKKKTQNSILVLSKIELKDNKDHRFNKKIIKLLSAKNKTKIITESFTNISDLISLSQRKHTFFKIYVFLSYHNYATFINYYKNISEVKKNLDKRSLNSVKFYLYGSNFVAKKFYYLFLKHIKDITFMKDTEELIKTLRPTVRYQTYKFDYDRTNNRLILNFKKKTTKVISKCLSYQKLDKIDFYPTKNQKFYYRLKLPPPAQVVKHKSLFYCLFRNLNSQEEVIYKIIYPKINLKLIPKTILVFYESKKIIENKIHIKSDMKIKNLNFSIKVKQIKGKPPTIFSHSQRWSWNDTSKIFFLYPKYKKNPYQLKPKDDYMIDLAVLGRKNDSLSGVLQIKSGNSILKEFSLKFKPYLFAGNQLNWLFTYFQQKVLILFFVLCIIIFIFKRKRKKIFNYIKSSEVLKELVLVVTEPQKLFLGKRDNPFNCIIPFIDENYVITVNDASINIKTNNNKKKYINLNESLGKAQFNLGSQGEILFKQEKFYDDKNKSVILLKVRRRRTK